MARFCFLLDQKRKMFNPIAINVKIYIRIEHIKVLFRLYYNLITPFFDLVEKKLAIWNEMISASKDSIPKRNNNQKSFTKIMKLLCSSS